jgi:hypothetical protein
MGEQDWEVYDVNTGKTLEIVKGKSKGEVADAVYDKYVDQGIGFQVRPYVDPATLTPRAKLAQRIATKKPEPKQVANQATNERGVPYWEIYSIKDDWNVIHTFLSDTAADAKVDGENWLKSFGAANPSGFAVRPKIKTTQVKDVEPDVAQNFGQPQDATNRVGTWAIYDVTLGREISRMDNVPWQQASDRADELEQSTGHNMSVRGLSESRSAIGQAIKSIEENFADGKVKGKSRPGRVKRSGASCNGSVTDLRARAKHASGEKAKMYHWCANMKSGKKK